MDEYDEKILKLLQDLSNLSSDTASLIGEMYGELIALRKFKDNFMKVEK